MTQRFLIHCPKCDSEVEIEVAQAGGQTGCENCSEVFSLPSMREIRKLPPVAEPTTTSKDTAAQWSPRKKWLFVVGVAMLVVCASLGGIYLVNASNSYKPKPDFQLSDRAVAAIDNLNASQLMDQWNNLSEDNVAEWREPSYLGAQRQSTINQYIAFVWFGLSAIGLILILVTFTLRA